MKENNIEKDIDILNNVKEYMQESINKGYHKFCYNEQGCDEKCVDIINAIDSIVESYKEALKENNRLEEQVEYDKTHIYTPQTIELNFISKSKIEDMIAEIEADKLNYSEDEYYLENEIKGYAIDKLKELLEKEEE